MEGQCGTAYRAAVTFLRSTAIAREPLSPDPPAQAVCMHANRCRILQFRRIYRIISID